MIECPMCKNEPTIEETVSGGLISYKSEGYSVILCKICGFEYHIKQSEIAKKIEMKTLQEKLSVTT